LSPPKLSINTLRTWTVGFLLDHLPVIIDTTCRSSFFQLPERRFLAHWLCHIPRSPGRQNSVQSGITRRCSIWHVRWETIRRYSGEFGSFHFQQSPARWLAAPMADRIEDEICPKNRLVRKRKITVDPALKAEVNRLQRSVNRQLEEWTYTSGARRCYLLISKTHRCGRWLNW
jgi:hypothetical protein